MSLFNQAQPQRSEEVVVNMPAIRSNAQLSHSLINEAQSEKKMFLKITEYENITKCFLNSSSRIAEEKKVRWGALP